jgi:NADH-quinone oxidoreductase subunit D
MSRELTAPSAQSSSLSESLGFQETVVEVGMTHPGVRRVLTGIGGTIGFIASLDDERMSCVEVEIGLGHRGFEKQVESASWEEALPYVSRLAYAGGLFHELAYCGALETLAGIEVPTRAVWLRMLGSELARITDHFTRLAAVSAGIALPAAESVAQKGALDSARALAAAVGRGPLAGWVRAGGVASALPPGYSEVWPEIRKQIEAKLASFRIVGLRNPSLERRLRGVGILSAEDCLAWNVTGPAQRAAGNAIDLRRGARYLAYDSLDFEVPIGENGDGYDRILVVAEEISQSLRLVDQCIEKLEDLGPGEIGHEGAGRILEMPVGEADCAVESATGELGFYVVSDGTGLPRRIRCRAPSFFHARALSAMLVGEALDDLLPTVASMFIVSPECDR